MMAYIALIVVALVMLVVGWWLRARGPVGGTWKGRAAYVSLGAFTASLTGFLAAHEHAALVGRGTLPPSDILATYRGFAVFAVAGIVGALWVREPLRLLLIIEGLVLAVLWLAFGAISV